MVTPEVAAVFERYHQFFSDDAQQLERYPEALKIQISKGENVDKIDGATGPFGRAITNPIPVNGPIGELLYLSSLRFEDHRLIFHRLRSIDSIDIYECVSTDAKMWDLLFFDMYHPRKSKIAPSGYRIETNALFGGTNRNVSDFPVAAYEAIVSASQKQFGMSFADPKIRIAIDSSRFDRPPGHSARVRSILSH